MTPIAVDHPPVKLKLIMSTQQAWLLQLAVKKQIHQSTLEFREFGREGQPNLATAAREDVEWLESVNILIEDLIYNNRQI